MTLTLTVARIKPVKSDGFRPPTWDCGCCHDTGTVLGNLIRIEAPEYNLQTHGLFPCLASNCFTLAPVSVDGRKSAITQEVCDRLAEYDRQDWENTEAKWNLPKNVAEREAVWRGINTGSFRKLPKQSSQEFEF